MSNPYRERLEQIAERAEAMTGSAPETVMFDLVTGRMSITATALEALLNKAQSPVGVTLDVHSAYEKPEYLVAVLQEQRGSHTAYSVDVLVRQPDGVYREREEVGEGPLRDILVDAARVIRTGTAVIPARG